MKIVVFSYDAEIITHYLCGSMNAAAPDGAPPRRINNYSKNTLPSVPRRGPEEGVLRIGTIFMVRV